MLLLPRQMGKIQGCLYGKQKYRKDWQIQGEGTRHTPVA